MIYDNFAMITIGFDENAESVLGKLIIMESPSAKMLWELFRKNPTAFEFAVAYIEDKDNNKELVEISLVPAGKTEEYATELPPPNDTEEYKKI